MPKNFAINPLQWFAGPDGNLDGAHAPDRVDLLSRVAAAGFTAISAGAPDGVPLSQYRAELDAAGLRSAPGYFGFELETDDLLPVLEDASRHARAHVELGVGEIFVAGGAVDERMAAPAAGAHFDPERLAKIATNVERVGARFAEFGVKASFHQHIGTWIETEKELRYLLDNTSSEALQLGPDTGHLTWAGIDPVAFIGEYAPRVPTLHIKDVRLARLSAAKGTYSQVIASGILTEPGRGDVDNDGVLGALGEDFTGWIVIEVDQPDAETPEESARLSYEWASSRI